MAIEFEAQGFEPAHWYLMSGDQQSRRKRAGFILGLSMFVMGGCGLAYEYTLSRIASDILGNSARQWALIIGIMMFFMGIGADAQKHLSSRRLLDKLILSELLLGLLGGFGPIAMLHVYGISPTHYTLLQYGLISAIGFLIGLEIPLITRINEAYSLDLKSNLGRILKMDYIGSLVGALAWIFLLPKFFSMVASAFVLSLSTVGVAALTYFYFLSGIEKRKTLAALLVAGLMAVGYGFGRADDWAIFAEQSLYRDRIVFSKTTKYQHIVLTKARSGSLACYINGRLQFDSRDEFIYHENLVHPAMAIAPRHDRVCILGGGDGLAAREVLKYPDVTSLTLVDIDPEMTDLASADEKFIELNAGSLRGARVEIIKNGALVDAGFETLIIPDQHARHGSEVGKAGKVAVVNVDAARFVEQIPGQFDVIILDFPDPSTLELAKLYARHFYYLLADKLARHGIVVQQSTSPYHAKEAFLCIGRTMEAAGLAVVPYHDNVPSFGEWGWWIGGRSDVFCEEELKRELLRIETIAVVTRYLTPDLIKASLVFGKAQLDSGEESVTTLTDAQVFRHYLESWRRQIY